MSFWYFLPTVPPGFRFHIIDYRHIADFAVHKEQTVLYFHPLRPLFHRQVLLCAAVRMDLIQSLRRRTDYDPAEFLANSDGNRGLRRRLDGSLVILSTISGLVVSRDEGATWQVEAPDWFRAMKRHPYRYRHPSHCRKMSDLRRSL